MTSAIREIPIKNYIKLCIIVLVTIFLLFYFYQWYKTYEENNLSTPIMNEYLTIINYNELEDYLQENTDATIYVSYLQNKTIRNFEKEWGKILANQEQYHQILYLDVTEELKTTKLSNELKEKYHITKDNLPQIIKFNNSQITAIVNIKEENYNLQTIENKLITK